MEQMPKIISLQNGAKVWEHTFDDFIAKVYIPVAKEELYSDIVNFGFRAPYLLVFEEKKQTMEEAVQYANITGLSSIAAQFAGSVVFIYPTADGGWENAPEDLYAKVIENSRISQYYQDGVAIMRDRFTGNWGERYIRGAVLRTYLYGCGASADYIAKNCIKHVEGVGLYGIGNIRPVACILENLSVKPQIEVSDIPIVSIANEAGINEEIRATTEHVLVRDSRDFEADFTAFVGTYRRMMGNLEKETDYEGMGMVVEPGYCTVKTSQDNRGDYKDSQEFNLGYVAYYNKNILESDKKVPIVLCFHGGGDSAMCMASVSGWPRVAAKYGFLLVNVEHHMNSTATEAVELLEQLKKRYPIDSEKVYSTGFSMGGCKSWDLMQEYPTLFAGVAPMDATFDVGYNVFNQKVVGGINEDVIVPVFYVGGEKTPLPELPFQEAKCVNRMKYVLKVNRAKTQYDVSYEDKENWSNPIWGIDGDVIYRLPDDERANSILTLNLFESENGCCYSIFGCVSDQQHEVRHHNCENAYRFLSQFRRLEDGTIVGGTFEETKRIFS